MKRYTVYANETMVALETNNVVVAQNEYRALKEMNVKNCYIIDNATFEIITDWQTETL